MFLHDEQQQSQHNLQDRRHCIKNEQEDFINIPKKHDQRCKEGEKLEEAYSKLDSAIEIGQFALDPTTRTNTNNMMN